MSAMHFYSNVTLPFILAKNSVCMNGMLRVIEYISTGNSMVNHTRINLPHAITSMLTPNSMANHTTTCLVQVNFQTLL